MPITCDIHSRFCRNMRARRLELEMTQQQLAEATGLYQPDISEFEAGRKEPSLKTISIIAKGLRIPPEAMLLHDLVPV